MSQKKSSKPRAYPTGKDNPSCRSLDGQRFGNLVVLQTFLPDHADRLKVLVRCDCGNELHKYKTDVCTGKVTTCRKGLCSVQIVNMMGKKVGFLTVVGLVSTSKRNGVGTVWRCECVCGEFRNVWYDSLKTGSTKSCGCKSVEMRRATVGRPPDFAAISRVLRMYKWNAKIRGLEFNLSRETMVSFIKKDCHYCGVGPSSLVKPMNETDGDYAYNGIDRMDSNLGYDESNCVTACRHCNLAKHDMPYDTFIALVQRIAARFPDSIPKAPTKAA